MENNIDIQKEIEVELKEKMKGELKVKENKAKEQENKQEKNKKLLKVLKEEKESNIIAEYFYRTAEDEDYLKVVRHRYGEKFRNYAL